ncbi:MAG: hypothetical protein M9894_31745 [Planctomycetes bacterium]|nr:hypothetical protein [Planctomycetota bacterium]
MSDARLREAERRWRESGALADEAAWLRERARAGALTDEALRLAAYVGHAAAAAALASPPLAPAYVQAWIYGLQPWGVEACQRAAIAAARRALVRVPPGTRRGRYARSALARVERLVTGLPPLPPLPWDPHVLDDDPSPRERAAFEAACAVGETVHEVARVAQDARAFEASARAGGAVIRAVEATDEPTVRAAVRDEVAAWALGERDPVLSRVL